MRSHWLLFAPLALAACGNNSVVGGAGDDADVADIASSDAVMALDAMDAVASDAPDVVSIDAPSTDVFQGCRGDGDCASRAATPVCDGATGRCVGCVTTRDTCAVGFYCDGATQTCASGCDADSDCAPAGSTGDGGATTQGRRCSVATRACVECVSDEHCPAGTLCVGNLCVAGCNSARACPAGQVCCGGGCVDTQVNTAHCGGCGAVCAVPNGAPTCANGTCAVDRCNGAFADCDGQAMNGCEANTQTGVDHCGACGAACAARANASADCVAGRCAYTCAAGFEDCDRDPSNGCEADTRVAAAHCGACGRACAPANATGACVAGVCGVGSCAAGFGDCDGNVGNGCETELGVSTSHCGASGAACSAAPNTVPSCVGGACAATCVAGFGECDGDRGNGCEVTLASSVAHCGSCGRSCMTANVAMAACAAGACAITACADGFADCDGNASNGCEADTRSSLSHCGACSRACAPMNASGACVAGACTVGVCAAGFDDCDRSAGNGCEVNTQSSIESCGMCGARCVVAEGVGACTSGRCTVAGCNVGRGDCDGAASNGCEVSLSSSDQHCGACGRRCGTNERCESGSCSARASCREILAASPAATSGTYLIDPDGGGGAAAFPVYCDMTSSGGGWTLVLMASSAASVLGYDSPLWTGSGTVNPGVTDPSMNVDVRSPAFATVPFTAMRFCLTNLTGCLNEAVMAASALSVFQGGERAFNRAPADFAALGYGGGSGCQRNGINVYDVGGGTGARARCRYGILMNNESTCEGSVDGGRGLGCRGYYGAQIGAGQGDGIVPTSFTRGFILVR